MSGEGLSVLVQAEVLVELEHGHPTKVTSLGGARHDTHDGEDMTCTHYRTINCSPLGQTKPRDVQHVYTPRHEKSRSSTDGMGGKRCVLTNFNYAQGLCVAICPHHLIFTITSQSDRCLHRLHVPLLTLDQIMPKRNEPTQPTHDLSHCQATSLRSLLHPPSTDNIIIS